MTNTEQERSIRAVIQTFNDRVWNMGELAMIDETFATNWVWHSNPPGLPPDRKGLKQLVVTFRAAFTDIRASVDDQVAEGDMVAWRWTFQAKHVGEFMGIPPTDKHVMFRGISIDRTADGKFAERWDSADQLGLLQQLGVIAATAPAT